MGRVFIGFILAFLWASPGLLSASTLLLQTETAGGPVRLAVHSRALVEGEAVLLSLASPPFLSASVRFSGRDHAFFTPEGQKGAFALIPLALDMAEGNHWIHLDIAFPDGSNLREALELAVTRTTFPTTVLRVDPRFTAPSPEEMVRVEKEREQLARIYKNTQTGWFAAGEFIRPLKGGVSSPFGVLRLFNDTVHSRHRGVDLRSPPGAPVRAANAGEVVFARSLFFGGDTVIIDHGRGLFTSYCHLSEITTSEEKRVEKGALVGKVGATGRATGPHLHWGARIAGTPVDPLSLLHLPFP
jgi:murein DD-endopeptidase MepM/ murein hydrolase activator NlpD